MTRAVPLTEWKIISMLYLLFLEFRNVCMIHRESWQHIPCHFFQTINVSSPFYGKFGFQGRVEFLGLCLPELCWDSFVAETSTSSLY